MVQNNAKGQFYRDSLFCSDQVYLCMLEQGISHHIFTVIKFKYIAIINESFYQVQGSASFPLGSCMVSPTHKFLDNSHGEALTPEDVLSYSFDIQL